MPDTQSKPLLSPSISKTPIPSPTDLRLSPRASNTPPLASTSDAVTSPSTMKDDHLQNRSPSPHTDKKLNEVKSHSHVTHSIIII